MKKIFLCFLLVERGLCAMNTTHWRRVYLANDFFEDTSVISSEISASSDLICAIEATKTVGINLFCFKDEICRMSNTTVDPSCRNVTGDGLYICQSKFQEDGVCSIPNVTSETESQDETFTLSSTSITTEVQASETVTPSLTSITTDGVQDYQTTVVQECPANFKRIGDKCYNIAITRIPYTEAVQSCLDQSAILAEPEATSEFLIVLVDELPLQFPAEFVEITKALYRFNEWPWLGIKEVGIAGDFKYLQSGDIVSQDNPLIIDGKRNTKEEVLVLRTTGPDKYVFDSPNNYWNDKRVPLCETSLLI